MWKKIKELLKNSNFRNNQNYIFWDNAKRKAISSFLMYKKDETYFKEKNPLFSMFIDWIANIFIEILNIFFYLLFDIFKINKFISLSIASILYLFISIPLFIKIFWSDNFRWLVVWIVLFWIFVLNVLYKFIKWNIDLWNWKIIFFIPISKKFSTRFKDNKLIEWRFWITKSFSIEKRKRDSNNDFLIFLWIFSLIVIFIISLYQIYKNIEKEKQEKINHEKLIVNLINWKELLNFERNKLYSKVLDCYEKNYETANDRLILKKWNIDNVCLDLEKNFKKEIVKNRKNNTREYFENKLKKQKENNNIWSSEDRMMIKIDLYKRQIDLHNMWVDYDTLFYKK